MICVIDETVHPFGCTSYLSNKSLNPRCAILPMSDHSKSATSIITKLYRNMDAINRAAKQPYQSFIGQMEHAMESLRCQQFGISKALLKYSRQHR